MLVGPRQKGWEIREIDDADDKFFISIFGESGVGKTTLGATAPKPLILDLEEGTKYPLRGWKHPVKMVKIRRWKELMDGVLHFGMEDHGFETLVVDTLTEAKSLALRDILDYDEDLSLVDPADYSHWNKLTLAIRELMNRLRDLNMNIVLLGQEREADIKKRRPNNHFDVTPDLLREVHRASELVDHLYRYSDDKDVRVLQFGIDTH
jgi:hypothetical protein